MSIYRSLTQSNIYNDRNEDRSSDNISDEHYISDRFTLNDVRNLDKNRNRTNTMTEREIHAVRTISARTMAGMAINFPSNSTESNISNDWNDDRDGDNSSDEDYIPDRFTSNDDRNLSDKHHPPIHRDEPYMDRNRVGNTCDNEANVVQRTDRYFIEPHNDNTKQKWPIKLKPHEKSAPYQKDRNLIGGVFYGLKGNPVLNDMAVFGFKAPEDLECHAGKCKPDTQHARLYKDLFGKCPEEEEGLVATGFSVQKDEGLVMLVFNSNTYNDKSKQYVDKTRYRTKVSREAGTDAQRLIKEFTEAWWKKGCPSDWTYSP